MSDNEFIQHKGMTAEDYRENTRNLLNSIIKLTESGTKVYLFDEPPVEPEAYEYTQALEVNDMGQPLAQRKITGVYKQKTNIVEKNKGFGTYKRRNEDGSIDILALTKDQYRLKQVTMAALVITDPHQFAIKCRTLWGGKWGVLLRWTCSEEFREDFGNILEALRNQIFMELSSAMLDPELTTKANFYLNILTKANPAAFGKQVVQANVKAEQKADVKADTTLKVVFGDL